MQCRHEKRQDREKENGQGMRGRKGKAHSLRSFRIRTQLLSSSTEIIQGKTQV